jgi:hypothetical protein
MKRRTFLEAIIAAVSFAASGASFSLRSAIAICSKIRPRHYGVRLPPVPRWNKLTDDIDSADFARRSGDYERSLLPPDLTLPCTGQIWEAMRECEVLALPIIGPKAPGFWPKMVFQRGDRIRVVEVNEPKPLQVRFQPAGHQEQLEGIGTDVREAVCIMSTARTVLSAAFGKEALFFTEVFRLVQDV